MHTPGSMQVPMQPGQIGIEQFEPSQPSLQVQLLGMTQVPLSQPIGHTGTSQTALVQLAVHIQVLGLLHVPPFRQSGLHTGSLQTVPFQLEVQVQVSGSLHVPPF